MMIVSAVLFYVFLLYFSSRGRHTRCAIVTVVQTCALPICHAEGPWIDRYERLLRWTLDNSKHRAKRAGYDPVPTRPGFLWFPFAAAAVSVILSIVQYFQPVPAGQSAPNPALHFLLMTPISAVVFFLVAALAAILVGALAWKFGEIGRAHV